MDIREDRKYYVNLKNNFKYNWSTSTGTYAAYTTGVLVLVHTQHTQRVN